MKTFWLLCCLILSACKTNSPTQWHTYTVTHRDLEIRIQETGTLGSAQEVWVMAPFAGSLSRLLPEGQVVKAGQIIGQMETTTQQQELQSAHLTRAEAELDQRLIQLKQSHKREAFQALQSEAKQELKLETLRWQQLKTERDPVSLMRAKENVRALAERIKLLELEAKERQRLFTLGYLSRTERDQAQLQLQQAQAEQRALQANQQTLLAGPRPEELAKQALNQQRVREEQRRLRQEQAAQARLLQMQSRSAQGRQKRAQERHRYYQELVQAGVLKAPRAGTLVYGKVQVGEDEVAVKSGSAVQEGVPLVQIVDLKQAVVRTLIHELDAPQIRIGQKVRLRFDAYPEQAFPGEIRQILPVARQTRLDDKLKGKSFQAEITLQASDSRLRPGMTALAEILVRRYTQTLTIPTQTLRHEAGQNYCWVLTPQGPQRRTVQIQASDARYTSIIEGLKAGEKVILNPLDHQTNSQISPPIEPQGQEP